MTNPTLLTDPPEETSDDLSSEEIQATVSTSSVEDLTSKLKELIETEGGVSRYERRTLEGRRYIRVRFLNGKSVLYTSDWLDNSQ